MDEYPPLEQFPDTDNYTPPSASVLTVVEGFGLLTAQSGDDLRIIFIHTALGPSPADGFVTVNLDPEQARAIASHLNYLADYAELGVQAQPRVD